MSPPTPFTSLMNSLVVAAAATANASPAVRNDILAGNSNPSPKFKSKIWSPGASCEIEQENGGNDKGSPLLLGAGLVANNAKESEEGSKRVKKSHGREERIFKVRSTEGQIYQKYYKIRFFGTVPDIRMASKFCPNKIYYDIIIK